MFVCDFNCDWLENPFFSSSMMLKDEKVISRISKQGIKEVYIDTEEGLDVDEGLTRDEVAHDIDSAFGKISIQPIPSKIVPIEEELLNAQKIHKEAKRVVVSFMEDAKLGKQVELEKVDNVVERMVDSIFRNKDALEYLGKVRSVDEYTFMHSVNVCVLMVSFSKSFGLDRRIIKEVGVGALLHDVGKMRVPQEILNKSSRLNEEEFKKMKDHVVQGIKILAQTPGVSNVSRDVALEHHERFDGSGYPRGLKGEEISKYGQMASIVDVYDAITSDRVYHKGMNSVDGLRKLYEWSRFHFREDLVQQFIQSVGIYPTGTLVRLESGYLAVVIEQGEESLLRPVIRVIYNAKKERYVESFRVNLSKPPPRMQGDRILWAEPPEKWNIKPLDFVEILPA